MSGLYQHSVFKEVIPIVENQLFCERMSTTGYQIIPM
jgi:hypothetical protein